MRFIFLPYFDVTMYQIDAAAMATYPAVVLSCMCAGTRMGQLNQPEAAWAQCSHNLQSHVRGGMSCQCMVQRMHSPVMQHPPQGLHWNHTRMRSCWLLLACLICLQPFTFPRWLAAASLHARRHLPQEPMHAPHTERVATPHQALPASCSSFRKSSLSTSTYFQPSGSVVARILVPRPGSGPGSRVILPPAALICSPDL